MPPWLQHISKNTISRTTWRVCCKRSSIVLIRNYCSLRYRTWGSSGGKLDVSLVIRCVKLLSVRLVILLPTSSHIILPVETHGLPYICILNRAIGAKIIKENVAFLFPFDTGHLTWPGRLGAWPIRLDDPFPSCIALIKTLDHTQQDHYIPACHWWPLGAVDQN